MSFLIPPNKDQLEHIEKEDAYRPAAELEEDVTRLIEWLSRQPHLPSVTDRQWLLHFIVGCKYSLSRAKQVIESYFIVRAELPKFFGSFTEEELEDAAAYGMLSILPKMTPEGYRVICGKSRPVVKDRKFDLTLYGKLMVMLLDFQLKEEPIYGCIFLNDLKHFSISQFMAFTPSVMKNIIRCCLKTFPLRMKSAHFVNPPKFMSSVITFFKMFLPKKLKNRLFVHDSLESLHQYIPKDVLPEIYGGTIGSIEKCEENIVEMIMSNKKWLDDRPKADLSKRHLKSDESKSNVDFKKLQID